MTATRPRVETAERIQRMKLMNHNGGKYGKPGDRLSPIQVMSLQLLADGHTYQTAAREMNISRNTFNTYCRIIYAKLGVHTAPAAVAVGFRRGLVR